MDLNGNLGAPIFSVGTPLRHRFLARIPTR